MSNTNLISRLREPSGLENDELQCEAADALERADERIAELESAVSTMQEGFKLIMGLKARAR